VQFPYLRISVFRSYTKLEKAVRDWFYQKSMTKAVLVACFSAYGDRSTSFSRIRAGFC
jgi:hypothetical protein